MHSLNNIIEGVIVGTQIDKVDAESSVSLLWWNDVFFMGTFYSNAYSD
jgi:hypothetical protein